MPEVRVEIREGRSASEKKALLEAVHSALVEALKIPEHDRIQRLYELPAECFEIPPDKTETFTLIEVTMFPGRSLDAKRALYQALVRNLGELGVPPNDVFVVLREPPMENWGIRGGVPASEVDLGFEVEV
jgi:phenylpyruvate tautomerase PptA (4-oxalocrotonate tautomerase family)